MILLLEPFIRRLKKQRVAVSESCVPNRSTEPVVSPSTLLRTGTSTGSGQACRAAPDEVTNNPLMVTIHMEASKVKEGKDFGWMIYFVVGTQLAVSIVAGLWLGDLVDKWIGTKTPWFTFIGLIVGVISGFSLLIRMIKRKNDNKGNETSKNADTK